jgi:hypothetical protein
MMAVNSSPTIAEYKEREIPQTSVVDGLRFGGKEPGRPKKRQ